MYLFICLFIYLLFIFYLSEDFKKKILENQGIEPKKNLNFRYNLLKASMSLKCLAIIQQEVRKYTH